jgi:hypothetical protein
MVVRTAAVLFGLVGALIAQDAATWSGVVLDDRDAPLADVAVCAVPAGETWQVDDLVARPLGRTGKDGRFEVPAVAGASQLLFVRRGYATVVQEVDHLPLWPVQTAPGAAVAGTVRNADGEPIEGARVVATDFLRGMLFRREKEHDNTQAQLLAVTRSDARGRFVLRGSYRTALRLRVTAPGHFGKTVGPVASVDPLSFVLAAREAVADDGDAPGGGPAPGRVRRTRRSEQPAEPEGSPMFAGALAAPPRTAAYVGVRTTTQQLRRSGHRFSDLRGTVPLQADGRFVITGEVEDEERELELLVVRPPRHGRPEKLRLGGFPVGAASQDLRFGAGEAALATARGRVGGNVPLRRLAVLCAPERRSEMLYAYLQYEGPICPVGLDGSFELRFPPGPRSLVVFDTVTGVMFGRKGITVDAGAAAQHDFDVDAGPVTVHLQEVEGRDRDDWFVEIVPPAQHWPANVGQVSGNLGDIDDYCRAMGLRMPAGALSVKVWLPKVEVNLVVREYSSRNASGARRGYVATGSVDAASQRELRLRW